MAQTPWAPVPAMKYPPNLYFQKPGLPFAYFDPPENLGQTGQARYTPPTSDDEKKSKAWKYEGYKEFSKWMASDDDFFVFRRFGSLNAGVILWMQDRITQIETRLDEIHDEMASSTVDGGRNSSFRWDARNQPERDNLMCQLSGLLHHYNQYIEVYSKVRQRPRAEGRQILNVKNWLTRGAINSKERNFINHEGDLVAVNSRAEPPLQRLLEACRLLRLSRFLKEKLSPDVHVLSDYTNYSSNEVMERLSNTSIIFLGFAMLMAPLWWLNFVSGRNQRLGIISAFLGVFMVLMATATVNSPFQVVASTAAYAAVLMVFMQISGK